MFSETSRTAVVVENSLLKPDCLSLNLLKHFLLPRCYNKLTKIKIPQRSYLMHKKSRQYSIGSSISTQSYQFKPKSAKVRKEELNQNQKINFPWPN